MTQYLSGLREKADSFTMASNESLDDDDQEPVSSFVSMNMSGRFAGKEIRRYGQQIIKYIIEEKDIGLFFGQQTNFRPSLPRHFDYIGNSRAFMVYNKRHFKVCDEKQYRHYLRDLELQGRLPRHYLPEPNFVVVKVKTRSKTSPRMEFIALSVLTDECMGKLRATSQMRKILAFVENVSILEQLPVVISGTFRLNSEDAKDVMSETLRTCGYLPSNKRRAIRASNFFVTSRVIGLSNVKPIVCSKIELPGEGDGDKWVNPEDVFYWDPVIATLDSVPERPDKKRRMANSPSYGYTPTSEFPGTPLGFSSGIPLGLSSGIPLGLSSGIPLGLPPMLVEPPLPPEAREVNEVVRTTSVTPVEGSTDQADGNATKLSNGDMSLAVPDGGVMKRIPSYVELYDEELMESNAVCYMQ